MDRTFAPRPASATTWCRSAPRLFGGRRPDAPARVHASRGGRPRGSSVASGDHAEAIALYGSEAVEESRLNGRFEWIARVCLGIVDQVEKRRNGSVLERGRRRGSQAEALGG